MDDWLLHKDIVEQLPNFYEGSGKVLLTIFGRIESVIERDFYMLVPLKRKFMAACLESDEFNTEINNSDRPLTRSAVAHERYFSIRIDRRIKRLPKIKRNWHAFFYPESQEYVATIADDFDGVRKKFELKLIKEFLLEDLEKIKRSGVFCFESIRFSERSLKELGETEREEISRGEMYVFKRTFRDRQTFPRMNSLSAIHGKVLLK
jgi:hypothetical protein